MSTKQREDGNMDKILIKLIDDISEATQEIEAIEDELMGKKDELEFAITALTKYIKGKK